MKQPEHYAKELDRAEIPINIVRDILQVTNTPNPFVVICCLSILISPLNILKNLYFHISTYPVSRMLSKTLLR